MAAIFFLSLNVLNIHSTLPDGDPQYHVTHLTWKVEHYTVKEANQLKATYNQGYRNTRKTSHMQVKFSSHIHR